jgi:hypothetical protein
MMQASSQPDGPVQSDSAPSPADQPTVSAVIIARAGVTYRRYRYIMFVLMLCFAGWFLFDGFKRWPEEQQRYHDLTAKIEDLDRKIKESAAGAMELSTRKTDLVQQRTKMKYRRDFDINLQRMLGFGLIPVALGLLVFWFRRSGGEFRLENGVLHLPGHPAVPLDTISTLDKTKWDRKGIAYAEYQLPTGEKGRFRLDDFIYDAHPIREIVKQVEASIVARAAALGVLKTPPAA